MSALAHEMREAIAGLAGPRAFHEGRKTWLARAARRAGISYRQAKAFFYGETQNPRVMDVEKVRAAIKHSGAQSNAAIELDAVVARLEAVVAGLDQKQARIVADRVRRAADRARGAADHLR
jgi:hypothetical protein